MPSDSHFQIQDPSSWVTRFAACIPPAARVLDLACGTGRHARWLAERGFEVVAADRDASALARLADVPRAGTLCVDLEEGPGHGPMPVSTRWWSPVTCSGRDWTVWRPCCVPVAC
jgi:SAM-dependent methyltransferase